MIETIKQYAELINIGLFAAIIGLLFRLSSISRNAIKDKSEAIVASLKERNKLLESSIGTSTNNHAEEIRLLQRDLEFYKNLSEMPAEKRIIAKELKNENTITKNNTSSKEDLEIKEPLIHKEGEKVEEELSNDEVVLKKTNEINIKKEIIDIDNVVRSFIVSNLNKK